VILVFTLCARTNAPLNADPSGPLTAPEITPLAAACAKDVIKTTRPTALNNVFISGSAILLGIVKDLGEDYHTQASEDSKVYFIALDDATSRYYPFYASRHGNPRGET
jgi:hypothetical protein